MNRRRIWNTKINNNLLLLVIELTDTLIEQTKTKPQGRLEFIMNKQMETFSFSTPINLSEEGKRLKAVFFCSGNQFVFQHKQ